MTYIIIGKKKLGVEFMYGVVSFLFTFFMGHNVTMIPDQPENIWFYMTSAYVCALYASVVFANPGFLTEKEKRLINQKVRFPLSPFLEL